MTTHRPSKRRWQALALAAAVTALPWLQGCTTNPATGEQNLSFVSQEEERRLGAEAHPKILQQFGGEYKDPEIQAYVRSIGQLLARSSELPNEQWTFTVIDSDIINAFAVPGGYIYISRGLIALADPDSHGRRKGRATVPMTTMARQALAEARRAALTEYVIEYAEKPVASIKRGFTEACRRGGLKNVTPHTLRHTAAVWMAEAGRPMPEIAAYLGHGDSHITERVYAKYSPDYLRRAAGALDIEAGH